MADADGAVSAVPATAATVNGPEGEVLDWALVDWHQVEEDVRRLRQRIFTASQAGDLKKVRNLQKLMLRSRANALLGWQTMIKNHGAVEAARRLVANGDIQSGFERLVRAGRPDLTIEWAVTDPYWRPLFALQYRDAAQWRLNQAGVIRQ